MAEVLNSDRPSERNAALFHFLTGLRRAKLKFIMIKNTFTGHSLREQI